MALIAIDIGHGSDTFPTHGKGVYRNGRGYAEHNFNSKLGIEIRRQLEAKGHKVVYGQEPYKPDIPLSARTNMYNNLNVDLTLSVHANYNNNPNVDGRCAFYWYTGANSKRWAELLIEEIKKKGYSTHGNGLHASTPGDWTELHINRETNMPAILVEHGFMGNDKDFQLIFGSKQDQYVKDMADAQVNAIQRYLGLSTGGKWKESKFLKEIKDGAIAAWKENKILPSLVGAQAALESGWGESGLSKDGNNLFGIKSGPDWKGKVYKAPTKEFIDNKWITVTEDFRAYDSWADSVKDHGKFFTSTDFRKENYKAVIGETNYKKAVAAILEPIAKAGYATDPKYASKIISIIETWDLTDWDNEALGNVVKPASKPTPAIKETIIRSYPEKAMFEPGQEIWVYDRPDSGGKHVATYKKGDAPVVYHTVHIGNKFVWIQYTRASGKGEGYLVIRTVTKGKYDEIRGRILDIENPPAIKTGAKVRLKLNATHYATGEKIPNSVKNKIYTILQVGNGRVLLKELYSWVYNSDLSQP